MRRPITPTAGTSLHSALRREADGKNEPRYEAIPATGRCPSLNNLFATDHVDLGLESLFEFGPTRIQEGPALMIDETSA